ncbi:hypothetical protein [Nocardia farcinica]|uniref:hypothetical protein n=1 Tax=Nocardia farcinica TaxID=37329 RepID=UPI00189593A3|nr:hypothetical protein [Nocardia farcinica]MBF6410909.1 hypothetical protein [Nocardia farcinica]
MLSIPLSELMNQRLRPRRTGKLLHVGDIVTYSGSDPLRRGYEYVVTPSLDLAKLRLVRRDCQEIEITAYRSEVTPTGERVELCSDCGHITTETWHRAAPAACAVSACDCLEHRPSPDAVDAAATIAALGDGGERITYRGATPVEVTVSAARYVELLEMARWGRR